MLLLVEVELLAYGSLSRNATSGAQNPFGAAPWRAKASKSAASRCAFLAGYSRWSSRGMSLSSLSNAFFVCYSGADVRRQAVNQPNCDGAQCPAVDVSAT
jgi:hypothetical protein